MTNSEKLDLSSRFLISLNKHITTGWFRIGKVKDKDHFYFMVFHTHPADGDKTDALIRPLLSDFWVFDRFESNRFLISSARYYQYSIIEKKDRTEIEKLYPNLGRETANELEKLIVLIDKKPPSKIDRVSCPHCGH